MLNIERIEEKEGEEREKEIETLAKFTYMKAKTQTIEIKANKMEEVETKQINMGIIERPKVKLVIKQEIEGIKVILSNGKTLIDTEKGISKNVNGLKTEEAPILIFMDEEIMHGSTIKVKYKITVENEGEIDTMSNYFKYEEGTEEYEEAQKTITTTADLIYNYTNKNLVYKEDEQDVNIWNQIEINPGLVSGATLKEVLGEEVVETIEEENIKVLETEKLGEELYPKGSIEAIYKGARTNITETIVLSKVITPENGVEMLTYENSLEIVQRSNGAGRRDYNGVPGNYVPNTISVEHDSSVSRKIEVTIPLGQQRIYYVLIGSVLILALGGVVAIKKLVLPKRKNEKG